MTERFFWKHFIFPLVVFVFGLLALAIDTWLQLFVLALCVAAIWGIVKIVRRKLDEKNP